MGVRGEIFSEKVILPNRTYFFNVKENRLGDLYLNIVESKNKDSGGFDRQSVILFADDLQEFLKGFEESLKVMEKAMRGKKRGDGDKGGERKPRAERNDEREEKPRKFERGEREERPKKFVRSERKPHSEEKPARGRTSGGSDRGNFSRERSERSSERRPRSDRGGERSSERRPRSDRVERGSERRPRSDRSEGASRGERKTSGKRVVVKRNRD